MTPSQASAPSPRVSVLMTVYNAQSYLARAVRSILNQTFTDFELICVDDGSTDDSTRILDDFARADLRVKVLSRPNTGQVQALNDGLRLVRGEYLARMDADDISTPTRIEEQVRFLDAHPNVLCVGSCALVIDPDDDPINVFRVPLTHQEIECRHARQGLGGGILHPVATMRTSAIRQLGGYRREYSLAEDLDLWLRMAEIGQLANLESLHLQYRLTPTGLSFTNRATQNSRAHAAVNAARKRRGIPDLPNPSSAWNPDPVDLLREVVVSSRREGFWKSAQKYSWKLVRAKPTSLFGWRVLAQSTVRGIIVRFPRISGHRHPR